MRQINLRVDEALLRLIDEVRDQVPRNAWIERACQERLARSPGVGVLEDESGLDVVRVPEGALVPAEVEHVESAEQTSGKPKGKPLLPGQRKPGGLAIQTSARPPGATQKRGKR